MKKIFYLFSIILLISCVENTPTKQKIVVDGFAQGTTYNITYISENGINYQRSIDSM